jgi:hypothetical protein
MHVLMLKGSESRKIRRIIWLLLTAVTAVSLLTVATGCSAGGDGWGVILWSHDESVYPTGSIIPIVNVSQLNSTYDIRVDRRSPVETVPQWRVSLFKRKSQAEGFIEQFAQYADLYAIATLDGLPVRDERNAEAKRTYKLREGEVVKVLSRDMQKSVAGDFEGYWYQVLTDGGVTGFSFGTYLEVLTAAQLAKRDSSEDQDEFLEHFLSSAFRPKYFRNMLVTRQIDLDRFLPDYGIFPDPDNGVLHIVTEDHTSTIEYTGISQGTEDSYRFEGSTLLMIVKHTYEVNLQYADEGVQYSEDYVRIDPDIDLLIITEIERRAALFEDLYANGNTLSSSAYGTITLVEGGGFYWEGYERLVPDVISRYVGNSGLVDFRLHLAPSLTESYDGVISFLFSETDIVHFLYREDAQGVRYKRLVLGQDDKNLLIEEEGNSPIVIFFRVSATEIQ